MIGIIIEAETNKGDLPNKILYRIGDKAILEHVVQNALRAAMAHRVLVAMPASNRADVVGSAFRNNLIDPSRISEQDRLANYQFKGLDSEPIKRLHDIAMHQGLDLIVRLRGDCPLVPTWLINEAIYVYMAQNLNCYLHTHALDCLSEEQNAKMYPKGLEVEIFPFWMLTRAKLYCEDQDLTSYLATNFQVYHYENTGDGHIPNHVKSLRFESRDQLGLFESLLHEIFHGADLGDMLGDLNEEESDVEEHELQREPDSTQEQA